TASNADSLLSVNCRRPPARAPAGDTSAATLDDSDVRDFEIRFRHRAEAFDVDEHMDPCPLQRVVELRAGAVVGGRVGKIA
ncbi:MAG: hypothetical protein ABI585_16895, partial [Betaproteobacteria bacterium]